MFLMVPIAVVVVVVVVGGAGGGGCGCIEVFGLVSALHFSVSC